MCIVTAVSHQPGPPVPPSNSHYSRSSTKKNHQLRLRRATIKARLPPTNSGGAMRLSPELGGLDGAAVSEVSAPLSASEPVGSPTQSSSSTSSSKGISGGSACRLRTTSQSGALVPRLLLTCPVHLQTPRAAENKCKEKVRQSRGGDPSPPNMKSRIKETRHCGRQSWWPCQSESGFVGSPGSERSLTRRLLRCSERRYLRYGER